MGNRQEVLDIDRRRPLAVVGHEGYLPIRRSLGDETCQELCWRTETRALDVAAHHVRPQIQRISVVIGKPIPARDVDKAGVELRYDLAAERPIPDLDEVRNNDICRAAGANDLLDCAREFD